MTQTEKENIIIESDKFLKKHLHFGNVYKKLSKKDKEQIINCLSSRKGIVPYKKIKSYESLNIKPTKKFLDKINFCSSFKIKIVGNKEYEEVEKLFSLLKMRDTGNLNDLYNFQDTIIFMSNFQDKSVADEQKIQN